MSDLAAPYLIEERICGETCWIAIRARGADWSWLTPDEAAIIGRAWLEKYNQAERGHVVCSTLGKPIPAPG
jgi:hypothetical protein